MAQHIKNITKNKGFTIHEIIIVVVIIAVLIGISINDAVNFINLQADEEEHSVLLEIEKALEVYAKVNGSLPSDAVANQWATDISAHTNLSAQEILTDVWGNDRLYVFGTQNLPFKSGNLNIFYAAIVSRGANGVQEVPAVGAGALVAAYNGLVVPAASDDQLLKYTDYNLKIANYEIANKRINKIGAALMQYQRSRSNEALAEQGAFCDTQVPAPQPTIFDCLLAIDNAIYAPRIRAEEQIYVPPATGDAGNYGANVIAEVNLNLGVNTIDNATGSAVNDAARLVSMQGLMTLLGLPAITCCNPADLTDDDNGGLMENPFVYNSNPGTAIRPLPATITVAP